MKRSNSHHSDDEIDQRVSKKVKLENEIIETLEVLIDDIVDDNNNKEEPVKEEPLSESQRKALDAVIRGENVFITGGAGVGKSFLIDKIKEELTEMGNETYYVCATTGSAAYNIGGMTIHSFAGIGLGDKDVNYHIKTLKKSGKDKVIRWQATHTIIIDEISMLNATYFDKLNQIAKTIRNCKTKAFGGMQVILVGDFAQIPPIMPKADPTQKVLSKVESQYAFQTPTWRELKLTMIKLCKNFRQQNDDQFASFLHEIRMGNMTTKEEEIIRSRDISRKGNTVPDNATKIFSYRNDVLRTNQQELAKINAPSVFYDADIYQKNATGNTSNPNQYPVDARIELKVGASVLLCFNLSTENGLYNGSRGVITSFVDLTPKEKEGDEKKPTIEKKIFPMVLFDNGMKRIIRPHTWNSYEKKTILSSFTQIPLVLSYALTTHKCQGLTLNSALVDMKAFCTGQTYVGMSRVRRIEDLYITNFVSKKPILADPIVIAYYRKHNLL